MERIRLNNGLRVVLQQRSSVRTTSITLLVKCGTIQENKRNNGIAHFLEHMLFRKSADIESIGGQSDAFTYRTYTRYSINIPSKFLVQGLKFIYNIVFAATFDAKSIDTERGIILKEIKQPILIKRKNTSL